jgi:hypothetical protein
MLMEQHVPDDAADVGRGGWRHIFAVACAATSSVAADATSRAACVRVPSKALVPAGMGTPKVASATVAALAFASARLPRAMASCISRI